MHFSEEPFALEDLEGYRSLKNLTGTYLDAGENLFGKIGFRRWLRKVPWTSCYRTSALRAASRNARR